MGKHVNRKNIPKLPTNELSKEELQQAWKEYLDYHVGTGYRPKWEFVMSPDRLEKYLEFLPPDRTPDGAVPQSERVKVYLQALEGSIDKLPFMQRFAVKNYFGIEREKRMTQVEIAAELGYSQKTVSKLLKQARKNLKAMIRREKLKLVLGEIQSMSVDD